MSPQDHEAIMQAEDLDEPPENGGVSTGCQTRRGPTRFCATVLDGGPPMLSRNSPWTKITSRQHCEDEA
jgi:hypothetical protein